MSVPFEHIDIIALTEGAAVAKLFHPSRSFLTKILATSNDESDFTLELFSSNPTTVADAGKNVENYRVLPELASSGGVISQYPLPPAVFVNEDGNTPLGNPSSIYVRISGSTATAVTVTLASYNDIGGS